MRWTLILQGGKYQTRTAGKLKMYDAEFYVDKFCHSKTRMESVAIATRGGRSWPAPPQALLFSWWRKMGCKTLNDDQWSLTLGFWAKHWLGRLRWISACTLSHFTESLCAMKSRNVKHLSHLLSHSNCSPRHVQKQHTKNACALPWSIGLLHRPRHMLLFGCADVC
jgi:hypothetical protein